MENDNFEQELNVKNFTDIDLRPLAADYVNEYPVFIDDIVKKMQYCTYYRVLSIGCGS